MGIGIVGKVLLLAICIAVGIWSIQKLLACRTRHHSYKAYFTARSLEEGGGTSRMALTYQRPQRDEIIERYGPPDPSRTTRAAARASKTSAEVHISPSL
jgi:hypothetical protein